MRVAKLAKIAGAAVLGGFLAVAGTGWSALEELKVGGPHYERLVLGKDLLADILPPPEYIIESFLVVTLALDEPQKVAEHKERLATLRKDYETRHAFWQQQTLPEELTQTFLTGAHVPAEEFYKIAESRFIPALEKGDLEGARAAHGELRSAYNRHRAKIDETVVGATKMVQDIEAVAASRSTTAMAIVLGVALLGIGIVIASIVGALRGVVKPIALMAEAMREMAFGNTEVTFPGKGRKDEIGEMADAADVFRENAIARLALEQEQAVVRERELDGQRQLEQVLDTFKSRMASMVTSLDGQVSTMRTVSTALTATADKATGRAATAAEAVSGAADNSQAVAAATEELGASIKEISTQAQRTSSIVSETTDAARKMDTDVAGLADATSRIGSVVELIRRIADQTNLLALNATIESARAGEAGKGFAVVASEVKSLASQTGHATDEIAKQIEEVQLMTRTAVEAIHGISQKVGEIDGLTGAIAAAVEQQDMSTREIAQNVSLAADRSRSAAHNVEGVTAAAQETRAEAQSVSTASDELSKLSTEMKGALGDFLKQLSSDLKGRRAHWRKDTDWEVVVLDRGVRKRARAFDVSRAGMRLELQGEFSRGHSFEIDYGAGFTKASVVWSGANFVGVRFAELLPQVPDRPASSTSQAA